MALQVGQPQRLGTQALGAPAARPMLRQQVTAALVAFPAAAAEGEALQ